MATKKLQYCVCGGNRFMNGRSIAIDELSNGKKTRNWQSSPEDANVLQCSDPKCSALLVWDPTSESYVVKQA